MSAIGKILRVVRLHIVLGGVLAFTLGALLAMVGGGTFDFLKVALFYAVTFFGDLSTHFSNDFFDVDEDRLIIGKKFFSGKNILVNNPNILPLARLSSLACLTISISLASIAVAFRVAPIELLIITLGANFLGWFYSAPPLRLVSRGLGEAAIALAVGFAIPAVGYLAVAGHFDALFGYFVLPFLVYGFMLALSLQAPDIEADRRSSKKNIGVRNGERVVFGLIFALASVAFMCFILYAWQISGLQVDFLVVAAFSTVPLAAGLLGFVGAMGKKRGDVLGAVNVFSLFAFNMLMLAYLVLVSVYPCV